MTLKPCRQARKQALRSNAAHCDAMLNVPARGTEYLRAGLAVD